MDELSTELEEARNKFREQKAQNASLESDMTLLYQKHRQELSLLDAKYHRQDYKSRYQRVLKDKQVPFLSK